MPGRVLTFEDFQLDPDAFELRRAGELVPTEPQVFEVLELLVRHAGRVVSKDEIIAAVWPSGFISDAALNSRIMAARKAVGDSGERQRLIRTIRGRGYRFIGDVALAPVPVSSGAAGPGSPPDPPGQPADPHALETPATSFIGRRAELQRLEELLRRPACRLVTIVGPGGVGKTRLASHLARRLASDNREVITVGLHAVLSVHDLHLAIARETELQLAELTIERIAAALARRDAVIVLDNMEQLLPEAARSLGLLVTGTSSLRLVVTSREVVGLREEWVFPIGGLGQESASETPSDAEVLFLEREAQSGGGAGEPTNEAVRRICQLVDGMPLGIELAAALRRYLAREEIAAQVASDISVLQSDLRDVPVRHRSIPVLLDESLRRLDAQALQTLLALSVFDGAFTLASAQQVAGAALPAIRSLVDRSLVQASGGVYSLHPLLRQLALDRLGPRRGATERAHAEHYARFMSGLRPQLESHGQMAAAHAIDAELREVLSAWRWAARAGRLDLIEAIAYPAYLYAHVRSRFPEIRDALDESIAAAEQAGEAAWRLLATLLTIRVWLEIRTTRAPRLLGDLRRSTLLYLDHDDAPPVGFGMDHVHLQAMLHWGAGRYDAVQEAADRAGQRAQQRDDALGQVGALWLGAIARDRLARLRWEPGVNRGGTYVPVDKASESTLRVAASSLRKAAELLGEETGHWFLATLNIERCVNEKARGNLSAAVALARRASELRTLLRDRRGAVDALITLGDTYMDAGDPVAAREVLAEAERLVHRLGDLSMVTEYERSMGLLRIIEGDLDGALALLVASVEHSQQAGAANNVLGSLRGIGDILALQGNVGLACDIHAFVWSHPATTPFSVAKSSQSLEQLGIDANSLQPPDMRLHDFATRVINSLR